MVDVVQPDERKPGIVDEDIEGRERVAGILAHPNERARGCAAAGGCRDLRDLAQVDMIGFHDIIRTRVAAIEIGYAVDLTGLRTCQIEARGHKEVGAWAAGHCVSAGAGTEGIVAAQPKERVVTATLARAADEIVAVVVS